MPTSPRAPQFRCGSESAAGPLPDLLDHGISFDDRVLADALLNIYHRNFDIAHEIEPNIFQATRDIFDNAAAEGIAAASNDGAAVNDSFLNALRHNIDVFSAFRTHKMQNDIAAQLLTSDGKLKPFSKFVRDVSPYIDHKNRLWLQTEYNTAVLRAHQAAAWQQFESEKDVYPNLKWLPSTSPDPGADHRIFWNTVRPVNDPFWDQHRPGDRWNCKCDLVQSDDPVTDIPKATVPSGSAAGSEPSPGLENNPAKDKQLFSDKHPYFPQSCSSCPFSTGKLKALFYDLAGKRDCSTCPWMNSLCEKANREKGCETIETSKGSVTSNNGQGKQEKEYNEQTAKFLAEKYGHDIVLLPRKNDKVSADAWNVTLKIKQEYKRLLTKSRNALDMALKKAAKQADDIVVNITIDYNDEMIIDVLSDRVRRKSSIKSVWLIKNNKSVRMTRDEILSFNANKKIEWE